MPYYRNSPQGNRDRNLSHGDWKYTARKWRYFYDNAEDAYGKAKKDVNKFIDTKITGKTANARAAQANRNAKTSQRASNKMTQQFKNDMTALNNQRETTREQYTSDTRDVAKRAINKRYAAVHLPGHADKANANLSESRNARNTNLDKNKKTEKELGSKTADTALRVKTLTDNAKKYVDDANKYQKEYNKSLAGKAEKTGKKLKSAAKDAADWVEDTYKTVSKNAEQAIDKGTDWAKDTWEDASDWAESTVDDISKSAEQAIDSGTEWVKGLFSGKKKKKKKK